MWLAKCLLDIEYRIGCNEFIFYSIFIWLTLFSLYFSILRTICFLTFFDSRPPSFAKLTFCKLKFSKEAVGTKIGHFLSEYFLGTSCMPLQRKVKGFFHIYDDSKLAPQLLITMAGVGWTWQRAPY